MEVKAIVQEIQRLPLSKMFFVIEQTLKSIKKEELSHETEKAFNELYDLNAKDIELTEASHLVSEKSLGKDWLSEEDNRWDEIL